MEYISKKTVADAVNQADPVGLFALGAPADEYEPEIRDIHKILNEVVPLLHGKSDFEWDLSITHHVAIVFRDYFEGLEDLDKVKQVADEILESLTK